MRGLDGRSGIAVAPDGSLVVADATAARLQRLAVPTSATPAPAPVLAQAPVKGPMPWPIAPQFGIHEVVGLMGEVRGSYDGESRDHFHGGLDVRADIGSHVLAVTAAKVTDPYANWGFGTLTEGLTIGAVQRRQPVRDGDRGAALHQVVQRRHDQPLARADHDQQGD